MQPGRSAVLQPHIWLHQVMGGQVSAVVVGGGFNPATTSAGAFREQPPMGRNVFRGP